MGGGGSAVAVPVPLLALLPEGPGPSEIGTGVLAGSAGETVTVTRATAKIVRTAAATVATVVADKAAVSDFGLLVEVAHTNLAPRSPQLDQAPWDPDTGGGGAPGNPTVTANAANAPDGTMTADQVDFPACSGGGNYTILHSGPLPVSSGTPHAVILWVKGVSGSGTLYLSVFDSQWNTLAVAFTTTWQRFVLLRTASATEFDVLIGVDLRDGAESAQPAQSVYLWEAGVQPGPYALSDVQTAGTAATCNKDQVTMDPTPLPVAAGSVELEFRPLWTVPAAMACLLDSRNGSDLAGLTLRVATSGEISLITSGAAASTTITSSGLTWTKGQAYALRAEWGSGNTRLYRDEVLIASNLTGTAEMPSAHSSLHLGETRAGGNQADGYLNKLKFFA